jgi:hypothetical protein
MMSDDQLSDSQLLQDIENAYKEYGAYVKLYEGYKVLSELPDDCAGVKWLNQTRFEACKVIAESCSKRLSYLNNLKSERGLE